jgi:hypothetical protein
MNVEEKIFGVRDVSRALIAFSILILALNFNHYLLVYILGAFSLFMGVLNLFSLNWWVKFIGALDMALIGVYITISTLLYYSKTFGPIGSLLIAFLGLVLLFFSLRFIHYSLKHKGKSFS